MRFQRGMALASALPDAPERTGPWMDWKRSQNMRTALLGAVALVALAAAPAAHAVNIITWAGPSTNAISSFNNGSGSTTIFGTNVPVTIGSLNGAPTSTPA